MGICLSEIRGTRWHVASLTSSSQQQEQQCGGRPAAADAADAASLAKPSRWCSDRASRDAVPQAHLRAKGRWYASRGGRRRAASPSASLSPRGKRLRMGTLAALRVLIMRPSSNRRRRCGRGLTKPRLIGSQTSRQNAPPWQTSYWLAPVSDNAAAATATATAAAAAAAAAAAQQQRQ
jgi:hypothetical protein